MSNLITITSANFAEIVKSNPVVVIDFWAEWCQPCLAFAPIFNQVAGQFPGVMFGKVNTEAESELTAEFAIRSIPTLIIFRQEVILFNESGVLPEVALIDLIEQAQRLDMQTVLSKLAKQ